MENLNINGIDIVVEGYRVVRLDNTNVAIQVPKTKGSGEAYYDNIGYYSSEEAALRKLYTLVTKDVNKSSVAEAVNTYIRCSNAIIKALKER